MRRSFPSFPTESISITGRVIERRATRCARSFDYPKSSFGSQSAGSTRSRITLRCCEHFRRLPSNARLVIAGEGPLKSQLNALVKTLALGDRVLFPGFQIDVLRWMRAADGFVLSSRWEGLPIALLEACACELPAVITDIPGAREVLRRCAMHFGRRRRQCGFTCRKYEQRDVLAANRSERTRPPNAPVRGREIQSRTQS